MVGLYGLVLGSRVVKGMFDAIDCLCEGLVYCMKRWRGDEGEVVVGEGTCRCGCQLFLGMRESGEECV